MLLSSMKNLAVFFFHGSLNDFLPEKKKGTGIRSAFNSDQSVKHLIESLGVPHTEVGCILVNGARVEFGYLVADGDRVDVYPQTSMPAEQEASGELRFVIDNHLGRLAAFLRMLGFDSLYRNDYQDDELARITAEDRRILLTRDRRLLMRNQVQRGYWVRSLDPRQQVWEVVERYKLYDRAVPFRRCIRCNGVLQPVSKESVLDRLEPLTRLYFEEFRICPDCQQVYWKGSHYERMREFIDEWVL